MYTIWILFKTHYRRKIFVGFAAHVGVNTCTQRNTETLDLIKFWNQLPIGKNYADGEEIYGLH